MEMTIVSSILHSFYNGIENIILAISKDLDQKIPEGSEWHRKVLKEMEKNTKKRNAVFSQETSNILLEYLGFRHFFRHSYSFHLNWEKLKELIVPIDDAWGKIKQELRIFIDWMMNDSRI